MKELVIMSCSTGFTSYDGTINKGVSYIERLTQDFDCKGLWINGLTILHVLNGVKRLIRGNKRKVLIHVGAVEAFSHPAVYFLHWACNELLFDDAVDNEFFKAMVVPKMYWASRALAHGDHANFQRILEPEESRIVWTLVGKLLEGSEVYVVGMTKPLIPPAKDYMLNQAVEMNMEIYKACEAYSNLHFIDIWEKTTPYIQDSNHLNEEGHEVLYNTIRPLLED